MHPLASLKIQRYQNVCFLCQNGGLFKKHLDRIDAFLVAGRLAQESINLTKIFAFVHIPIPCKILRRKWHSSKQQNDDHTAEDKCLQLDESQNVGMPEDNRNAGGCSVVSFKWEFIKTPSHFIFTIYFVVACFSCFTCLHFVLGTFTSLFTLISK